MVRLIWLMFDDMRLVFCTKEIIVDVKRKEYRYMSNYVLNNIECFYL